jgi:flavin-dependent dehydrogenase
MVGVFMEMPAIKQRLRRGGDLRDVAVWQLNFGSQDMRRAYEGALLIGDAAGLINPLTGGGIHNGLMSAVMAADVIHEGLRVGDLSLPYLRTYERRMDDALRGGMRKSYLIQRTLLGFPTAVELLIRWGGSHSQVADVFISKL